MTVKEKQRYRPLAFIAFRAYIRQFPFEGTISNCRASANSGNGCFSNTEAISFRMFEPSVLGFPVNVNGFPTHSEK